MAPTGTPDTRLVLLRGPSGSGKTSTALAVRARLGRGVAWVEQDHQRRILLREHDAPPAVYVGLIDSTVRYCLDHGYHVLLEGILPTERCRAMLLGLISDHRGRTACWYFDNSLAETLRRHATRPLAAEVAPEQLRAWYQHRDLLPGGVETLIPEHQSLDTTVEQVIAAMGLPPSSGGRRRRDHREAGHGAPEPRRSTRRPTHARLRPRRPVSERRPVMRRRTTSWAALALALALTVPVLDGCSASPSGPAGDAQTLWPNRTAYTGDASRVAAVIAGSGFGDRGRYEISLQTAAPPYGVTIAFTDAGTSLDAATFDRGATLTLGLVGNLDHVTATAGDRAYTLTAAQASKTLGHDVKDLGRDEATLRAYLTTRVHPSE